jgi:hypothetical protein
VEVKKTVYTEFRGKYSVTKESKQQEYDTKEANVKK